jgi:hypothetical protein
MSRLRHNPSRIALGALASPIPPGPFFLAWIVPELGWLDLSKGTGHAPAKYQDTFGLFDRQTDILVS